MPDHAAQRTDRHVPRPLVSIMMPAFNAEKFIEEAIASVLAQTAVAWELVVVDDGSVDATARLVAAFDDPRIRLVQQQNGGEAAARNTALRHLRGTYVAFLDADDLYLPQHLARATHYLDAHPGFAGVYSDGHYCDATGRQLVTLTSRRRGPYEGDVFAEAVRGSDLFGPPVSVVLRRNVIVEHALQFDESITIGPDWVFLMQVAAVGQFGYLDERTCLYRLHTTNISLQVDLQRRARELAKCRARSIAMPRFSECPLEVRTLVLHDLLVNLLRDDAPAREAVLQSAAFRQLPDTEQARILRLMASQSILIDAGERDRVRQWLQQSNRLDATDLRSRFLLSVHRLSPWLSRAMLGVRRLGQVDPLTIPPFADVQLSTGSTGGRTSS